MNTERRIQDYLANRLSEKDRIEVENLLETDADFKSEFESHRDIFIAFKIAEAKKLKTHFQELEDTLPKEKSNLKKFKYAYLAIASILVIGFFYNILSSESGNDLFESNFEISPNTYQPVTRSNNSNKNNSAFIAYENGDFITAEKEFEVLLATSNNPNIRFYYASSLLNQSKIDSALKEFKTLNAINFEYLEESLWYTALIYLKKEDYSNSKAILNKLDTINSAFEIEKRKQLTKKLNGF
ncbi:hypothetical protein [Winogradskyella forsetii]|uniref:hypothetical protein n=1 Tax=Winogradskyella forsetii TaxID=2686077 RepID=UPI0015B98957|nr:hypothetical protein [Winogradskyella forsetii]